MNKEQIVGRLLCQQVITADEAIILLEKDAALPEPIVEDKAKPSAVEKAEEDKKQKDFEDYKKKLIDIIKEKDAEKKPCNPYGPFEINPDIFPNKRFKQQPWVNPFENPNKTFGDLCSCNPKNGGSGVCFCTMGNEQITCHQ